MAFQYRLPDRQVVSSGVSFNANGRAYQANFLELASPDDLAAHGIAREEIPDPPPSPPWVPETISDRQFFHALAVQGLITQDEALAAVSTGTIPATLASFVSSLPAEDRFAAKMLLSGAVEFRRDHPLTAAFGAANNWTSEQVDDLWRLASGL